MLSNMYKNFLSITKDSMSELNLSKRNEGPIDEESEYGKELDNESRKENDIGEMRFKSSTEEFKPQQGIFTLHHDQVEDLMKADTRENISKEFIHNLSSPKLQENLRNQYKTYKNPEYQKAIKDIGLFNSHEVQIASKDPLIVGQAKKINHAILDFVDKETKGLRQKGILDIYGSSIQKNPIDYIHKEASMAKEIFGNVRFLMK